MRVSIVLSCCLLAACGDDGGTPDTGVSTAHCMYEPLVPTARAGGMVSAAALQAGTADRVLHVPVGTALGGYTGRAGFLDSAGVVDARKIKISGAFNPSIGVTAAPRVKAVALRAGDETVVMLKFDAIFAYDGLLFDLETRLGPDFAGKVMIAASHTHSGWAQFTGNGAIKLGSGQMRQLIYDRILADFEAAAREAIGALRPAKLGVFHTSSFDPENAINRDRRPENDSMPGGTKDAELFLIRIDGTDDVPIAVIPIFGEHGTLQGQDNPFASTDATGALERVLEEQFASRVVVMHLQSAGADSSPTPHGSLDCSVKPGAAGDPCLQWTTEEGHGRAAVTELMAAWTAAGNAMRDSLELEMVTRSIETGPKPETFAVRSGSLRYAPFDIERLPDGKVYETSGALATPIDEFNAPVGAALCDGSTAMFPAAAIPGTQGVQTYGSCLRLDIAGEILGEIFSINFEVSDTAPICEMTRTTISALRIGDYVIGTMPGELSVLLAKFLREKSPVGADKTILVGYAQGHVGYLMAPEDWVLGGYESSITFWGPLEAEMIADRLLELMPLAVTPIREDGTAGGTTKVATATMVDDFEIDDPAMMAGTVPASVPTQIWARTGAPTQAQPASSIPRVSGVATFVWIGDDPNVQTPRVTLEYETSPGTFEPVARRSGRVVDDAEIVLAYTPQPLQRSGPQTHYWVAEWQAVPWVGAVDRDGLGDRGGLPLGTYRFHVAGKGWTVDSAPFEVVEGGMNVTAMRTGNVVRSTVRWHAPKGWRLLDMALKSNQPVPVRNQQVTVELRMGGTVLSTTTASTDGNGVIDVLNNDLATTVRIADRFGNEAYVTL